MDREEAKKKVWDNKSINTISKVECDAVIDQIFDEQDGKVCDNCIYCVYRDNGNAGYIFCDKLEIEVPDDIGFGCTEMKPIKVPDDIQD